MIWKNKGYKEEKLKKDNNSFTQKWDKMFSAANVTSVQNVIYIGDKSVSSHNYKFTFFTIQLHTDLKGYNEDNIQCSFLTSLKTRYSYYFNNNLHLEGLSYL